MSTEITRIVGAPAVGTSFFDRKIIVEKICERIPNNSILLVAPRRFGKTSIMFKVKELLDKQQGRVNLYLDVEWITTPSDFIVEIICKLKDSMGKDFLAYVRTLPKGVIELVKDNIENIEISGFKVTLRQELENQWMERFNELLKMIKAKNLKITLFADEFPLMVHNMCENSNLKPEEIRSFLYWLRSLRVEQNLRMVIGGSIGIDYILESLKASAAINDLEKIHLGPFDRDTAKDFITRLMKAEKVKISDKDIEKILTLLGEPIPYFLQVFVAALLDEVREQKKPISDELVETVYERRILGVECKSYFDHYFQRLSIYYGQKDLDIVKTLLLKLAETKEMSEKDLFTAYSISAGNQDISQFKFILNGLQNDFYIAMNSTTKKYQFTANLLRDLWLKHYKVFE